MSKEIKEMVEPSIVVFGFMLQEAILDGWRISDLLLQRQRNKGVQLGLNNER
jgi:hypothetical protein